MMVHDVKKLAVVTPSKCGTKTTESVLKKHDFWYIKPRHVAKSPDGYERFMIVRHPRARLASMYKYGHAATAWFTQYDMTTFETFLQSWVEKRDRGLRSDWTRLFCDYLEIGGKAKIVRLEEYPGALEKAVGLPIPEKHIHASRWGAGRTTESFWGKRALKIMGTRLDADLKIGRY